jgi:acyloxyacyl hydrolase
MDYDLGKILELHVNSGGNAWEGIEVTDGFHPSQTAQVLLAKLFWVELIEKYEHILGEENIFNAEIEALQNQDILNCK